VVLSENEKKWRGKLCKANGTGKAFKGYRKVQARSYLGKRGVGGGEEPPLVRRAAVEGSPEDMKKVYIEIAQ